MAHMDSKYGKKLLDAINQMKHNSNHLIDYSKKYERKHCIKEKSPE